MGLNRKAEEIFRSEGIEILFPPQEQAVKAGVMDGESLVVSTPTASGKTVIAELAALSAMRQGGQVVYIVPLRALASEKYEDFKKWEKLGFRVDLQMGDLDSKFLPQRNTADIVIATAEKCDSILRSRPNWFRDVRLLVIDEIHLITTDRGPTYEILIAKFKKMFQDIQILGLSATIGNAKELGDWLGAKVISSDWRPVKLTQRIVQGKATIMFSEAKKTLDEGAQSLVFVNSRRSAEAVAEKFAEMFENLLDKGMKKALEETSQEILEALSTPTAQCRRLARAVKGGAAFHHAGLVNKQRALVEEAFRAGRIKVIAATPTLAAGLNMPARKVIIRDIKRYSGFGLDYIPVLEYLQMCLPYEERIVTDKGILPIGKVVEERIACSVLSFNVRMGELEFKPIRDYFKRKANELIELTTDKGYKLRLTKEHPIRTGRGWRAAEEVKIGDVVVFNPYVSGYSYIPDFLDLLPKGRLFVSGLGYLLERAKEETGKTDKELGKELEIDPKSIYHYKKDVKNMPLSCAIRLLDMLKLERKAHIKSVKTGYGSFLKIPDRIDEDILWLAGIIATDGNIQRTVDKRTRSEYIKIRVFNNDRGIIEKSKRVMERLVSGKVYVSYKGDGGRCEIGNTLLGRVLNEHFGIPFGNKSEKVSVPPFLLNAPKELVGAYLGGVFDGDGSYTVTKNKRFPTTDNQRILFVSSSKKFAVGIQELLLKLGIVAKLEGKRRRLRVEIRGKSAEFKKSHYLISFNRKDYIKTFARYAKPVKCKIGAQYKSYHNLDKYYRNRGQQVKLRIVGKRNIAFLGGIKVYNIGVEGNENYIASGFLVHNCGRAGRPKYDREGESVLLAANEYEKQFLEENYINGQPENIHSQLGVEPVLRMHVLASIASGFTRDKKSLMDFFGATFFAYEYGVGGEFKKKVDRVLRQLEKWDFIRSKGGASDDDLFVSASDIGKPDSGDERLVATPLGSRVSELYIDPETAHEFVQVFEDPNKMKRVNTFGLLDFMCSTTELRPLLRVRKKEEDEIWGLYYEQEDKLLTDTSDSDYLDRFKTALMLNDWIEERTEDWVLENYGMAPGLLRIKLDTARWLAYSFSELVLYIKTDKSLRRELQKLEMRLKHGIKEELIPLASIKGIGRVRARKLFNAGIRGKAGIKRIPAEKLKELLGEKTAERILRELD